MIRKVTYRSSAALILGVVAAVGAVLSFDSLYRAAVPTFGAHLAAGFPLLVDALILGASLRYVAGVKAGQARTGWRLTAHAGVIGTIALNALASPDLAHIPWHVTAPAVWSVLVELTARDVLGEWRAAHKSTDRIPFRLWVTAPWESGHTALRVARHAAHAECRLEVGQHAAAVEAVRVATGGKLSAGRVRRILRRQLRAGSLPPEAVLGAVGWVDGEKVRREPEVILRVALAAVLAPTEAPPDTDTVLPIGAATEAPVAPKPRNARPKPRRDPAADAARILAQHDPDKPLPGSRTLRGDHRSWSESHARAVAKKLREEAGNRRTLRAVGEGDR